MAEYKKWQREKERERRAYMKQNNIKLDDIMTKDNVKKWLTEGKSYAEISRDYLGIKQELVSIYARQNGLVTAAAPAPV